jgi:hypothetical protein
MLKNAHTLELRAIPLSRLTGLGRHGFPEQLRTPGKHPVELVLNG